MTKIHTVRVSVLHRLRTLLPVTSLRPPSRLLGDARSFALLVDMVYCCLFWFSLFFPPLVVRARCLAPLHATLDGAASGLASKAAPKAPPELPNAARRRLALPMNSLCNAVPAFAHAPGPAMARCLLDTRLGIPRARPACVPRAQPQGTDHQRTHDCLNENETT